MSFKEYRVPLRAVSVGAMSYTITFPQRLVRLGLMLHKKDDNMRAQIAEELTKLNSNDLCVCGSGKSHATCCPDIAKGSVLAELLAKYQFIDQRIADEQKTQGVTFICEKGCSDCCSQYFYISMLEYFLIRNELVKRQSFFEVQARAKKMYHQLLEAAPQEVAKWNEQNQTLDRMMEDHSVINRCPPCPMLDESHCCSVYSVRPLVCRLYGATNLFTACERIYKSCRPLPFCKVSQRRLDKHLIKLEMDTFALHENVDWFDCNGAPHFVKPYPLVYWLSNDELYMMPFVNAISKPPKEFSKLL